MPFPTKFPNFKARLQPAGLCPTIPIPIRNARVVTAAEDTIADILMDGSQIVAVRRGLSVAGA